VGIIGRLTPVKNHRMLLEVAKLLKERGLDHVFKFFVVGDGELKQDLIREAAALGTRRRSPLHGLAKTDARGLPETDAVVLTSLNEGTPVSLIEAMASARPVIATDVGGVRDLMGEIDTARAEGYKLARHGILLPSGDSKAMAEALLFAVRERTLTTEMAERAKKHVLEGIPWRGLSGTWRLYTKAWSRVREPLGA